MLMGYTKKQLLIIGSLIAVLVVFDVFLYNYLNRKSSDLAVLGDLNQVRSALEINFATNTYYPIVDKPLVLGSRDKQSERLCLEGFRAFVQSCNKIILNKIPLSESAGQLVYFSAASGEDYSLQFELRGAIRSFGLIKGANCATKDGFIPGPCS
jgi:hypothetical protein